MKKLTVYRQDEPIATGDRMPSGAQWHRPNFVKVGDADSWEEAKTLCAAPIVEANDLSRRS